MPRDDRTGPVGIGPRDGRGRRSGKGRGQSSREEGQGKKTGGKEGGCE